MKNILEIPRQETPHFSLPPHTITWEQDLSCLKQEFSEEDLARFLALHALAEKDLKQGQKETKSFQKKHPNHPAVLNLLTFFYLSRRKILKGNRLIQENYAKNPTNLFARINYADLCLRKKKVKEVEKIFNHTWNLVDLYPERKIFHVSEFRGFMVTMGFYHLAIGKREGAECYHYLALKVDPDHPGTAILGKKLFLKRKKRYFFRNRE